MKKHFPLIVLLVAGLAAAIICGSAFSKGSDDADEPDVVTVRDPLHQGQSATIYNRHAEIVGTVESWTVCLDLGYYKIDPDGLGDIYFYKVDCPDKPIGFVNEDWIIH
jgi:hypothetical protein